MVALGVAYAETKSRMLAAAGDFDSPNWAQLVPATPEWTVLDVVAHVTGLAADGATGALPADVNLLEQFRDDDVVATRDAVADGQVLKRRGRPPSEVAAEWDAVEPALGAKLRATHQAPTPSRSGSTSSW